MNLKNNTIKYSFIFIILLLFFYNCKTTTKPQLIEQASQPSIKELNKKYYRYDFIGINRIFYQYKTNDRENPIPFKPIIYTNIEESIHIPNFPKAFLRISYPKADDLKYFVEKMNGEYVLYMEKEGRVTMREYGKWYGFDRNRYTRDSIKVLSSKLNTDKKIFDYLKQNNIKYKLISKKTDGYYKSELKILLEANHDYTYITYSPDYIVTNMYYNAKDTLYLNNNFGRSFFGL